MIEAWGAAESARLCRVPGPDDDKYSRGVVGLRTGSKAYPGAAVLSVEGAWRAGAGMVRWLGDPETAQLVMHRRPETVLREGRAGAWVLGCGIDAQLATVKERARWEELLTGTEAVVVDAGALDLVAGAHAAPLVLTPHAGEFARLADRLGTALTGDRAADAAALAATAKCTVLLKGAETVVADAAGRVVRVSAAPGWLATAGSGDVLAGMIGAFLTQNPHEPPLEAAAAAACVHGLAGRIAAGADDPGGGRPITALEIAAAVPAAIARARGAV